MHRQFTILILLFANALSAFEYSGNIALEGRTFLNSPSYANQLQDGSASVSAEIEFFHEWTNSDLEFEFTPFFRWDSQDDERTHADIRELYLQKYWDNWDLTLGISKVFWGVTESQHLVDIINQTDAIENLDGEDKLGQPMIRTSFVTDQGDFTFFILPYFRERTFPGVNGRLRPSLPIDTNSPIYESSAEDTHTDFALRWSHIIGDVDIGLHYFYGTSRDPIIIPGLDDNNNFALLPYYSIINQFGIDLQYTKDAWLWKLEAITRSGHLQDHEAAVAGFEYTFYQIAESNIDVGSLLEYHYDSRDSFSPTPFNRDVFIGTRISLNDEQDTSLIAGTIIDTKNSSTTLRFEFERRLGSDYKLELEAQIFSNIDLLDPLYSFRNDDFIQISLGRYF